MRAVAGLIICARALAIHVFRPTYLSMSSDVEELLGAPAAVKPSQESFVRAVLHKVLPEQQRKRGERCSELVVDEVFAAVASLVPVDQHAMFRSRLCQLMNSLRGSWQRVQRLDERVEPCLVLKTPYDWQPLPRSIGIVAPHNHTTPTTPCLGDKEPQTQLKELKPAVLSTSEIVKVVWPAFLTTVDDEAVAPDPVCYGYVLTRAGVQDAEDEENSRRATRRAARSPNGGAQRSRRDSAVFLSRGPFNASEVK
ncbi:hypothetical protein BDP55DRAFT_546950 [Colletotrichum godetiae]|uniref:Uncharacterized protein n=1 Tax=Colletotrichum godetiae TaxID=1209918 RepID=A0AAJ0AU95_9PEZI|nr:uncharacterized protein BDP55DRAFT_546950 [Colletotrichum godetiae]KAK1688955.1 hypothetical protein BDP55DRAFT_546950 [Colletotrichum godetiae]